MKITERYTAFINYFEEHMPIVETELDFGSPYELIVAVILSAQCTDKRVNIITPALINKYPTAEILAKDNPEQVFQYIKSCSYPNNKARHLVGMARILTEEFRGVVPDNMEDLQKLPGVGRKTANVILSVAFQQPAMAVDTHVFRVSGRIGLTNKAKNPLETELQLVRHIPQELIHKAHHWLILHGRYVCRARKPKCEECGLAEICKYYKSGK